MSAVSLSRMNRERTSLIEKGGVRAWKWGLVIGTSAEDRRTMLREKVERYRYSVSPADEEGFRFYQLREPRLLTCFDIPHPFLLDNENGAARWQCRHPTGGYVVWDGQKASVMRVIQRDIFEKTYQRVMA